MGDDKKKAEEHKNSAEHDVARGTKETDKKVGFADDKAVIGEDGGDGSSVEEDKKKK